MLPGQTNDDFTIGGSAELRQRIRGLLTKHTDIFSFYKGEAISVAPMEFTVDAIPRKAPDSPPGWISVGKHTALNRMIDDLLDLEVIQLSRATAWSQFHFISNGWRFMVDFHNLNKVISNERWQITNMKEK